ncbi:DUF3320 domain-containing protein [Knoellia subterranea]|uniref:Regulator n=1 Tax=Knoellia subterranea KCTC 19937 TaxID=1385521 RepID=A0A0A0JLB7_9MICO|nr:DUF3320 domain-containing protein [Knoellia subterranea]KGN37504.1 regulator [Knoellia subterranea KCTC 19937]
MGGDQAHAARPTADVTEALRVWRDGLVNLTGTNRALNFKHSKTGTVSLTAPGLHDIYDGLRRGVEWQFEGEPDPDDPISYEDDATQSTQAGARARLHCRKPNKELGSALRNLARRANQEFLDRGLSVMYVALGMLHWKDVDDTQYMSPLLLVPVQFISMGRKNSPHLRVNTDDDPTINPALALRLVELGVTLPTVDDLTDLSVEAVLARVQTAVAAKRGWTVSDDAVLSAFSFMKEAMYRDLVANEATITAHPLVNALANQDPTSQDGSLLFDEIQPENIDRDAPPENTPLVLDADSSQRACVAAAVAGRSFVMDGPPGTGKSQTIANMIGALLHAGKTVLFVSEKAAALEVVRNRLAHVGLENYLLELHSHKASRKEVAAQLATALDTIAVAPPGMAVMDRRQAAERRESLNAYAAAMNRVRSPLEQSLHHVLGMISQYDHLPAAPTPAAPGAELSQESLAEIADAASRLQRAWRPATQGTSYLWRQVIDRSPMDARLYSAENGLAELSGTTAHNANVMDAFALTSLNDLHVLVRLLALIGTRPPGVHNDWLTTGDFSSVQQTADAVQAHLDTIRAAHDHVAKVAGVTWTDLPDPATLPARPTLTGLSPAPLSLDDLSAADAREIADRFERDATLLEQRLNAALGLATALRLPAVSTIQDIDTLLDLADAAFVPHRPERAWLTPAGLDQARGAAQILHRRVTDLASAETAARRLYTDAALAQPLSDLHERFTNVHKGLRKLFGDYRRDKKAVAAFTTEMVSLEEAIHDLGLAVAWSESQAAYDIADTSMGAILGRYWNGRDTDFDAIDQALAVADDVLRRTPETLLPSLTDHVTSTPEPALKALIDQTRADLFRWRISLAPAPARTARPDLLLGSLEDAITWLRTHLTPLRQTATIAQAVSEATARVITLSEATTLLAARQGAVDAHAALDGDAPRFEAVLGQAQYRGTSTDTTGLATALAWAQGVRIARHGVDTPLNAEQVKALELARLTDHLPTALQNWESAAAAITAAFHADRHTELARELDDPDSAASLLADFRSDSTGQEEWIAYTRATEDLASHGLIDVVRFCTDTHVPVEDVGRVIQRAVLRSWADAIMAADTDLQPVRAEDRSALIEQFRALDRQLIPAATGDIIRAVNSRRPASTDVGEPALIRREGAKKTRHLPVRDLISRTRTTTLAIKPCFMMSPLAVSQYLPPDMKFDVVIFDEASQVTPGDAVNCVYRGRALITAGDDKQLPPTSFFDRMTDDEAEIDTDVTDFQSILELSKASGAFRNLGLRWHYRSRHESLIAFSNQNFYEGKLVTFPGSHSEGPDVGVELFHVHGEYRRGTSRDNPMEAEHVARRILHHFDTRPDTSLGVVTFSVAQADAIQSALDRVMDERPDLADHLDGDRLHGFFIKSLESVQGDERDVMIFSIGYGPDEHGKVTSNFGALNKSKGWKRLNVAITRARQRVEIVTSIRAGDIPDSTNESVRHLTGYLDFAERGMSALALDLGPSGLDTDSPFEDSVLGAIRAMGFTVEPQVGAAGYRIDIGVRHPAHPGVYAIGIECDGYMYHSSPAARDRDRLRQQVLEGLGWRLHRIWGTAWYRDRPTETIRLQAAIELAINAPVTGRLSGVVDHFERAEVAFAEVDRTAPPAWVTPYVEAAVPRLPRWADPSDPGARFDMVEGIEVLAREEGPVHIDVVHQRLRDAWYIGRIGQRIRENINAAIRQANVTFNDEFLDIPGRSDATVRVPTDDGAGLRTAGQVPDIEIRIAVTNLLKDAGTVSYEDLMTATARVFGWNRRGQDITSRLDWVLRRMRENDTISLEGGAVRLVED